MESNIFLLINYAAAKYTVYFGNKVQEEKFVRRPKFHWHKRKNKCDCIYDASIDNVGHFSLKSAQRIELSANAARSLRFFQAWIIMIIDKIHMFNGIFNKINTRLKCLKDFDRSILSNSE